LETNTLSKLGRLGFRSKQEFSPIRWRAETSSAARARRIYCIINCHAGSAADEQRDAARRAFERYEADEIESIIEICERPESLARIVRHAIDSGADVIVAGGGDGTISSVANHLVGTNVALGVLPFGTLNHFAKDMRIPLDPAGAVETICRGEVTSIDVGEVNGRYFINNSSLGVYPDAVRVRERWRPLVGKWAALCIGVLMVLRRFPILRLKLEIDGTQIVRRAPLLFIGNNEYLVEWPDLGGRAALDQGCLSLWMIGQPSRFALLRSALNLALGRLRLAPEIEARRLDRLTVRSRRRRIRVAIDGEVTKLRQPLNYRVHPRSLNVCIPSESSGPPED
jgi:YegS/Rv2252/BmrU family lipid kinase